MDIEHKTQLYLSKIFLLNKKIFREKKSTLTMRVDPHSTGRDVRSDTEVGDPQIFNLLVLEQSFDGAVEFAARQYTHGRIRDVGDERIATLHDLLWTIK